LADRQTVIFELCVTWIKTLKREYWDVRLQVLTWLEHFSVNVDHYGVEQAFMPAVLCNNFTGLQPLRLLSQFTVTPKLL
jgi:hypothetical protein